MRTPPGDRRRIATAALAATVGSDLLEHVHVERRLARRFCPQRRLPGRRVGIDLCGNGLPGFDLYRTLRLRHGLPRLRTPPGDRRRIALAPAEPTASPPPAAAEPSLAAATEPLAAAAKIPTHPSWRAGIVAATDPSAVPEAAPLAPEPLAPPPEPLAAAAAAASEIPADAPTPAIRRRRAVSVSK